MFEYTLEIIQPSGTTSSQKIISDWERKPEMIVRSQMCWYGVGTVFKISGKVFRKVKSDDAIKGYADLEEV